MRDEKPEQRNPWETVAVAALVTIVIIVVSLIVLVFGTNSADKILFRR